MASDNSDASREETVPIVAAIVAVVLVSGLNLAFLYTYFFPKPTWLQHALLEHIPSLIFLLVFLGLKCVYYHLPFLKITQLRGPFNAEARKMLLILVAVSLLAFALVIFLPHFITSLQVIYLDARYLLPDEHIEYVRKAFAHKRWATLIYFLGPKISNTVFVIPVVEEVLFRGILFRSLLTSMSPLKAGATAVIIFTFAHVGIITSGLALALVTLPIIALVGVMNCYFLHRTQCLWIPIMYHVLINGANHALRLGGLFV